MLWTCRKGGVGAPTLNTPALPWTFSAPGIGVDFYHGVASSLATTDEFGSCQLWNPAGSGVVLYCADARVVGGAATGFLVGFATEADETAGTEYGSSASAPASSGQIRSATYATDAGSGLDQPWRRIRVPSGMIPAVHEDAPVIIPEGWGLSLRNLTANQDLISYFVWAELPASIVPPVLEPEYVPGAAMFDGTTAALIGNSNGPLPDGKVWTLSFFYRWLGEGALVTDRLLGTSRLSNGRFVLSLSTGASGEDYRINITARNSSGTTILSAGFNFGAEMPLDANWHHIAISFDLSDTTKRWAYFDGIPHPDWAWSTYTNAAISISDEALQIGRMGAAADLFRGDLGPVVISNTLVDLSQDIGLFIQDGIPVQPVHGDWPIVFDNPAATYHVNKGTLGDVFMLAGTLGEASTPVEL
jgi:hypothetical protein